MNDLTTGVAPALIEALIWPLIIAFIFNLLIGLLTLIAQLRH